MLHMSGTHRRRVITVGVIDDALDAMLTADTKEVAVTFLNVDDSKAALASRPVLLANREMAYGTLATLFPDQTDETGNR